MLVICLSHAENEVISPEATFNSTRTWCQTLTYNRKQTLAQSSNRNAGGRRKIYSK